MFQIKGYKAVLHELDREAALDNARHERTL